MTASVSTHWAGADVDTPSATAALPEVVVSSTAADAAVDVVAFTHGAEHPLHDVDGRHDSVGQGCVLQVVENGGTRRLRHLVVGTATPPVVTQVSVRVATPVPQGTEHADHGPALHLYGSDDGECEGVGVCDDTAAEPTLELTTAVVLIVGDDDAEDAGVPVVVWVVDHDAVKEAVTVYDWVEDGVIEGQPVPVVVLEADSEPEDDAVIVADSVGHRDIVTVTVSVTVNERE